MSAIISDVKDDLQRLEELKRKIAEVKQELLSINGIENRTAFDKLNKTLQDTSREYNRLSTSVKKDMASVTASSMSMTKALGAIGGVAVLKGLASQMISVRAEFQKADTAIQTMLGSKEQADKLMAQVREYAKISPLEFGDITRATQMMLSFNIEAEKVPGFIKAIGDVSMGESGRFNSLTLAFSQMSATGKLMGQDLNQMINAGFNPLSTMAEKTGKSIGQLKEEMSKGAITAEMVQQAFIDATSAGGKFFGMSENAAKTIGGQISMLNDAMDAMYNELGTKSEGVILNSISALTTLVENYKKVAEVLASLVVSYGLYKTALILATEAEKGYTVAQTLSIKATILAEKAQKMLNATMLKNPYVIAAVALGTLITALVAMRGEQERVIDAYNNYNKQKESIIKKEEEHRARIEELARVAGDESLSTDTRRLALIKLEQKYPSIFGKYDTETEKLKHIRDLKAEIAALDNQASIKNAGNELNFVERRIKELEKKGGWSLASTSSYSGTHTSSRTQKEDDELKALQKRRAELTNQIKKDAGNSYLANLTGVSNDDLKKQIDERRNLISKMDVSGKKYGNARQGGAAGIYTKEELLGQIQILEAEQTRRKKVLEDSAKNFVAEADEAYKKERDALKRLVSLSNPNKRAKSTMTIDGKKVSEMGADDFLAAVQKQQTIVNEAKKKVDTYKMPSTAAKKEETEARKRAEAQKKLADLVDKQKREQARKATDLEISSSQATIDAMKDGSEKTVAQIELDFRKQTEALKRGHEDLKQKKIDEARQLWEANPANKGKAFDPLTVNTAYTKEEQENYRLQLEAAAAERRRHLDEQYRQEQQYLYDYLKEWGSIQQQKEATAREYDQKIAEEGNAIQRESLRRQKEQALSELDFKELQQSIDWERVFGDLDRYSTSALRTLKENLRTALDTKDITVENAKVLAEKINEVDDRIISRSDAWASFLPILRERKRLTEEAVTAEQEYQRALSKNVEAQGKVMKLQQQATGILRANGNEDSDVSVSGLKRLLSTLDPASDAFTELTKIVKELEVADKALVGAISEEEKARRKQASIDSQLKNFNSIGKAFENGRNAAGGDIQWALQQASELNDLIDAVGLHDTEFGEGVKEFTDGTSHFASAIQKFQTGDFVGAATDAIKGIQDYGHLIERVGGFSFSGSNADEVRAYDEELIASNDNLAKSIDSLRDVVDKRYGKEAAEAAERARQQQGEYSQNILNRWANDMGYHDAHRSNSFYYDIGSENARRLNEFLSGNGIDKTVRADVWEDLMLLTPEEMKLVRDQMGDIWQAITNQGKYEWVYDALDEYADQAGKIAEIDEQLVKRMLNTSSDEVFSGFLDDLYDLASGSEDVFDEVGDNWQKMVNRMVVNNLVGANFQDKIKEWAGAVAKQTEALANGRIDETEYKRQLDLLQKEKEGYLREAQADLERYKATGIVKADITSSSDKSASALGLDKISYEQADQISGQLTAIQIGQQQSTANLGEICTGVSMLNATAETLSAQTASIRDVANDTRRVLADSYLELVEIRNNTGDMSKQMREMRSDVAEIKRDIHDNI